MVQVGKKTALAITLCMILISGCVGARPPRKTLEPTSVLPEIPLATVTATALADESGSPAAVHDKLPVTGKAEKPSATSAPTQPAKPTQTDAPASTPLPTNTPTVAPEDWKDWPVLPGVPEHLKEVYQRGLEQGNNPHAFSILGDCQSQPEVFMGLFDNDPAAVAALPPELRETVRQFAGSFDRYSPTVKDGTTEGALLWAEWNDNKAKKCNPGETPLECELRVQKPSIVFIHVGTHYEARNRRYLTIIIERLLENGSVPILVTKADNTELDERVNENIVSLAAEYDLPLWNFWASVQHLPEGGMEPGSNMYLNEEALVIHREEALQALDIVWRGVR